MVRRSRTQRGGREGGWERGREIERDTQREKDMETDTHARASTQYTHTHRQRGGGGQVREEHREMHTKRETRKNRHAERDTVCTCTVGSTHPCAYIGLTGYARAHVHKHASTHICISICTSRTNMRTEVHTCKRSLQAVHWIDVVKTVAGKGGLPRMRGPPPRRLACSHQSVVVPPRTRRDVVI